MSGRWPAECGMPTAAKLTCVPCRYHCPGASATLPSRPGEFHPEPLTDPDVTLSCHPARATARRLPPSVENLSSSRYRLALSQRR